MPEWQRKLYILLGVIKPQPPLWKPVYESEQRFTYYPSNVGGTVATRVNQQYLLTKQSAIELASLLSKEGFVVSEGEEPFLVTKGFESANFNIEYLYFRDLESGVRFKIIAGNLAFFYCPAEGKVSEAARDNSDVPLQLCKQLIQGAKLDAQFKQR